MCPYMQILDCLHTRACPSIRKMRFSLRRADPIFAYKGMPLYAKIGYRSNEKKSFDSIIRTCPYIRVKNSSTPFFAYNGMPFNADHYGTNSICRLTQYNVCLLTCCISLLLKNLLISLLRNLYCFNTHCPRICITISHTCVTCHVFFTCNICP